MELALDIGFLLPQTCHLPQCCISDSLPSFEQIVHAHYQGLYRFALSMWRREANAQDLVQQTLIHWAKKATRCVGHRK